MEERRDGVGPRTDFDGFLLHIFALQQGVRSWVFFVQNRLTDHVGRLDLGYVGRISMAIGYA